MKTVRTLLYGDCAFREWELELLHTPIMQRLYNLKQLGFTDRIYPDAIHSRFNHILGVADRASKIIDGVITNLGKEISGTPPNRTWFEYNDGNSYTISNSDLRTHVESRRNMVRLMALLHDITHIPYGHTLEDEMHTFSTKHDSPKRQVVFFNILILEFLFALIQNHNPKIDISLLESINSLGSIPNIDKVFNESKLTFQRITERYSNSNSSEYAKFLLELECSMVALLYLEDIHQDSVNEGTIRERNEAIKSLYITSLIDFCKIDRAKYKEFSLGLDAFTLDVIGNTICADLLDYIKRDCHLAGLHYDYDERIFKYFTLASSTIHFSNNVGIRLCLQLFTNKLRYDVASEIVTALRTRYLLSERILFHPTKCAAGAMLGCVLYMAGVREADQSNYQIDDSVFIYKVKKYVDTLLSVWRKSTESLSADHLNNLSVNLMNNEILIKTVSGVVVTLNEFQLMDDPLKSKILSSLTYLISEENDFLGSIIPKHDLLNSGYVFSDLESRIRTRLNGAKLLLWQLTARQFHKKVFRLSRIDRDSKPHVTQKIAETFQNPSNRYILERRIEYYCDLPYGSVVVHCPKYNTALKGADVLTFGTDPKDIHKFKEIRDLHELAPLFAYISETRNLESAYESIWNFFVFVHVSQMYKWTLVEKEIVKQLKRLDSAFDNVANSADQHSQLEREFSCLAGKQVEVLTYIKSDSLKLKPEYTIEFFEFIENETYRKPSKDITAKNIVDSYINYLNSKISDV